eukprot:UN11126
MKSNYFFIIFTIWLQIIIISGIKLLTCPCNADKLCAQSKTGLAVCNCWTKCNYECPGGFDRIDETTEYCRHYGDTRNRCSTTIICDENNQHSIIQSKSKKHKKKKSKSSATKNKTSGHDGLIGKTEADTDDTGYFKLSIVGFVLWQIASIGLGMLICGYGYKLHNYKKIQ